MPGPKKGSIRLTDEHRDKIRNSKILQRLIGHAEGVEEMSQTQVTAGLGLLKKCLPDLSAVEMDASMNHTADDVLVKALAKQMGVDDT